MNKGDSYTIGVDPGSPDGDYSCTVTMRRPGPLRKLLRKLKIDRSSWEYQIVKMELGK